MKIENKIKYDCVKNALIRWVLETDGQYDTACELLDAIPWGDELETVINWDDVRDEIIKSFGNRTDENGESWDVVKILTNDDELERFHNFITEKTNKVMTVYQGIIDKANELCNTKFEIVVSKFNGIESTVAQYKPLFHYFGNNLTTLANKVYDKLKVSDWENDDFIDSVHFSLYNNSRMAFKSTRIDDILHLDVKKNR